MNMLSRFVVVACLALPFTACKKEEAPKTEAVAAVPLPASGEQTACLSKLRVQRIQPGWIHWRIS